MVTSTSSTEENRLIIAVTGANSGLGLGLCHRLLRQLSVSTPTDPSPPLTLTLILACRSQRKAETAIKALYRVHDVGLASRRVRGYSDRKGWREGLRIVFEELDVDMVGGKSGVMDFAESIRTRYPYLTTLVLNAGGGAFTGLHWPRLILQLVTDPRGTLTYPNFIRSEKGRKSADGERGGVWGVNVLSGYILAKELQSHLAKSPSSLPYPPRIIYVSSNQANSSHLPSPPTSDLQLLNVSESYDASKYVGDLVIAHLDAEMSKQEGKVRCLIADPGIASTGLFVPYLPWVLQVLMILFFHIARILGSSVHTCTANKGAISMFFLITAPSSSLSSPRPPPTLQPSSATSNGSARPLLSSSPAPTKYLSRASRWGTAYVRSGEVGDWDRYGELAEVFANECDRVWKEWKGRAVENGGVEKVGNGHVNGQGVKDKPVIN